MQQDHSHQANLEEEQTSNGGAAPEHRRCRYTKADGNGCRDWAVRGQELCYRHGVFLRGSRGIDVPLLEDEASIVLVLSETLRAVAQGTIALKSGSLLLEGCRLAHTMHMEKQKAANAERTRRRSDAREEALREETQKPEAASPKARVEPCSEPCALSSEPCEEPCALSSEPCSEAGSEEPEAGRQEPGTGRQQRVPHICPVLADVGEHDPILAGTEPCALSSEPCEEPCALGPEPCSEPCEETTDDFDPYYEGIQDRVLAAQAERLDDRMEEELAVRAR